MTGTPGKLGVNFKKKTKRITGHIGSCDDSYIKCYVSSRIGIMSSLENFKNGDEWYYESGTIRSRC